ncbi:hypothetical protein NDU88_010788 [Pleurodeles waltl]|uniref:Reverse transcriptase zinc-binding domain-containing protein n=1 Tax=Pleurodeles waltl TaxID=8319 RepID=A0AAV7S0M6_PLEWA|nr:hypothetical protein NDU88_010788 [Pleurodeles waltl]
MAVADAQVFQDGGVRGFLRDAGLTVLGDWVVEGRLLDISEALSGCDGTALQRFCALRVHALLRERFFGAPGAPSEFRSLEVLCSARSPSKLITKLYNSMQELGGGLGVPSKTAWERDVGEPIPEVMCRSCCAHMKALSPNYRLRLLHFKFLHRLYYTPKRLHSMGLLADACCARCGTQDAGFLHLAWECAEVYNFWEEVWRSIAEMIELELPLSPKIALLGYMDEIQGPHRRLVGLLMLLAKRRVAMCWGQRRAPRRSEWLRDAAFCHDQLSVFWELMPEGSRPKDIWAPLNEYLAARTECAA